ncbi:MAG: DUF1501 domain-containing protein [Methylococcales bacterium]|nr:DUF1501 domain-containing protein [Methylococcales bacterium]
MKKKFNQNRRSFIQNLALFTGGSAMLSTYGNLQLMQSALAAPNSYSGLTDNKSLVCVFLLGGNDALNTLVPYKNTEYNKYAAARESMAIARNQLLPINGNNHGFHPSLPDLRDLYNEGTLAVANNVGNLFEPVTSQAYFDYLAGSNPGLNIPPDLFSHSHQTEIWQTNLAPKPGSIHPGWGGAINDLLFSANSNPNTPSAFTIAGNNLWQAGVNTRSFGISPGADIDDFNDFTNATWPPHQSSRHDAWNKILNLPRTDILQLQAAKSFKDTQTRAGALRDAFRQAPSFTTPFNDRNSLALQLRSVAKMIAARDSLGLKRQTFFVSLGPFDTHGNQLMAHSQLLSTLNEALVSFQQSLVELRLQDSVTTFTASEFGRTLTSNGKGTDHAWATDYMVMGGAVDGGKMHGDPIQYSGQPIGQHISENLFSAQDIGSGRFIPKYSTDQYGATLAKWMGINDTDLGTIFPNLNNFSVRNLGFMRS